jgi:hypothetical protein
VQDRIQLQQVIKTMAKQQEQHKQHITNKTKRRINSSNYNKQHLILKSLTQIDL